MIIRAENSAIMLPEAVHGSQQGVIASRVQLRHMLPRPVVRWRMYNWNHHERVSVFLPTKVYFMVQFPVYPL